MGNETEVLFEAIRRLSKVEDTIVDLDSVRKITALNPENVIASRELLEKKNAWSKDSSALNESHQLVATVCGKQVKEALHEFI